MSDYRIIAEIGSAHGDIDHAIRMATAAAFAGATHIKGQAYRRELLVSETAPTYGDDALSEKDTQWDNFASNILDWRPVAEACHDLGVRFGLSAFDLAALHDAAKYVDFLKLASADLTYRDLQRAAANTGLPLIISTGASTETEVRRAAAWVEDARDVTFLACSLSYPTWGTAHLARMMTLREVTGRPVGYSDHTLGTAAIVRAFALGASIVEKHFTITPGEGGDDNFAIGSEQLLSVTELLSTTEPVGDKRLDGSSVLAPTADELPALRNARRSWHASVDLPEGHVLRRDDLVALRPDVGVSVDKDVMGLRLLNPVLAGEPIMGRDLDF